MEILLILSTLGWVFGLGISLMNIDMFYYHGNYYKSNMITSVAITLISFIIFVFIMFNFHYHKC